LEGSKLIKPLTSKSIYKKNQKKKLKKILDDLPTDLTIPLFSKWAEDNRWYLPGLTVYPGKHDNSVAPHMVEILDRLHPNDECTHVTIMKSVQSTATTMSESAIGASIKYKLWNMLYLTADQSLAKIRSSANFDPMIDASGLSQYMKPISTRMKRKVGDNTLYKEFSGGTKLIINSYKSIGALKSNTTGFIICDEWDEAPPELKGQGDIQGLIEGRTMGLRNFKILFISTPTVMETSRIYKNFLEGDQRFYFVPCPLCGEMQILELKGVKNDYGLTFTTELDKNIDQRILIPETVRYTCRHCKKDFRETKKQQMLLNGEWRPTAIPTDRKKTSYHVSGLMSPEMFLSWERIAQQFINTNFGEDILKFKDFTINYKGWPWASMQKTIAWKEFRDRANNYILGEVPDGVTVKDANGEHYEGPLAIYAGCDVQGDRLELHVVAFGWGMEAWEIDFQVFTGQPQHADDQCWVALDEWVYTKTYKILGKDMNILLCAVDSGYDPRKSKRPKDFAGKANIVYDFVAQRTDKFIAIMGLGDDKGMTILHEARINEPNCYLTKRYNVSVALVKELIMSRIEIISGKGAIHFPRYMRTPAGEKVEIPDEHYKRFLSERYQEIKPGVYGWKKIHMRNEQWDTFIYAMAAAEFHNLTAWGNDRWNYFYLSLVNG